MLVPVNLLYCMSLGIIEVKHRPWSTLCTAQDIAMLDLHKVSVQDERKTAVLLRPYVQGVLWVTPHVHLIRCSDRDITGDWTWHMFIRGSDVSWGEIRYFHTFWGSIRTMFNCCHDGWQNAHRFSSEGHMTGDWTYGRNSTVIRIVACCLKLWSQWIR